MSSWFQLIMEVLEGEVMSIDDEVVDGKGGGTVGDDAVKEQPVIDDEHPSIRDELAGDSVMDGNESGDNVDEEDSGTDGIMCLWVSCGKEGRGP